MACNWPQVRCSNRARRFSACEGVTCFYGSCSEVCLEKAFDGNGWRAKQRLPVPKELGEASIVLLVHPTRAQAEIDKTCEVIRDVLAQAIA